MPLNSFLGRLPTLAPSPVSALAPSGNGAAYTINRLLGSSSTISLTSASHTNLTVSGNVLSATNVIYTGNTQTAVVREVSGQIAIEYPVVLSGTVTAPAVTPLPSGIAAMWDAASLTSLANGAAVTSWTDGVGGSVASNTSNSTTSHTYVADSGGGLPAVRLSGSAVMVTTGTNAANTALTGTDFGLIVVARNFQNVSGNPCLVSSGTGTNYLLQATPTQTGRFSFMTDCGDAGMRTIGLSRSQGKAVSLMAVNGTAIASGDSGAAGQVAIGGWKDASTQSQGKADVLAVLVFNRAVTAADYKQVHRHYCDLLSQAYPGGKTARNVSFFGDSITQGYPGGIFNSYPLQLRAGLNLPWGTWDQMGVVGYTWSAIQNNTLPMLGNVSAATGNRNIMVAFEFANIRNSTGANAASQARTVINALIANETNGEVVFGTSTDDGSSGGVSTKSNRTDYNAYWDVAANRGGIAAYVPIHQDPNIGVAGAAPTAFGSGNTYYADVSSTDYGLHLTTAGYAVLDSGPYGFRSAIQARLAA